MRCGHPVGYAGGEHAGHPRIRLNKTNAKRRRRWQRSSACPAPMLSRCRTAGRPFDRMVSRQQPPRPNASPYRDFSSAGRFSGVCMGL
jgi:hypothetical protein